MTENDEQLRRAVAGDREALAGLIQQHADPLSRRMRVRLPARWRSTRGDTINPGVYGSHSVRSPGRKR